MTNWSQLLIAAVVLIIGGGLYIQLRWWRSPRAYQAMIGLASCYLVAGSLLGAWVFHLLTLGPTAAPITTSTTTAPAVPSTPSTAAQPVNPPNKLSAKVVSITDGDTVDVIASDGASCAVRLAGIDAPEHDQAFGTQSTQHLASMISGKSVNLDCENERSYGRLICKILLLDGEDVDLDQVKAGMAWHYKQYEDEQSPADRVSYAAAECAAMKAKIGLWSDPHPVQPQDFRHGTQSPLLLDANGCRTSSEPVSGQVIGNARSHIFEWPGCPYYSDISPANRIPFTSPQAAEAAGYRPAHNCP
jgi:endonuclease YncB( thermonuclease family)